MSEYNYANSRGFAHATKPNVTAWWCPSCSIMFTGPKSPVVCSECDGDMTIAPERFQSNPRSKDHAP